MKVRLAHDFKMPKQCACCLAAASTALEARRSRKGGMVGLNQRRVYHLTVKIPYCEACARHVRSTSLLWVGLKAAGIWIVLGILTIPIPAVPGWFPLLLSAAYVAYELVRHFRSPGGSHIRSGPAARVAGLYGDEIHLEVANPKFAALLKEAQWEPAKTAPEPVPASAR